MKLLGSLGLITPILGKAWYKRQELARSAMVRRRVRSGGEVIGESPVAESISAAADWIEERGERLDGAVVLLELKVRLRFPAQIVARSWICLDVVGGRSKTRY